MELITSNRFDLMAKYLYIKNYDNKYKTEFYKDLYIEHFKTFNNLYEYPDKFSSYNVEKKNKDDFINEFNKLIESIKNNGFNSEYPIPVGNNNVIINGAHRLITSYYYNKKPSIKLIKNEKGNVDYNYSFFIDRKGGNPKLEKIYADTMALEYIKHNKNIRAMIIYPNVFRMNKLRNLINIINDYGYIYYSKMVNLNNNGINNLVKELYRGEEWIGGLFPMGYSPGGKAIRCISNNNEPTILLLIDMKNIDNCIELKNKCRELYNIGKHSLHISDYTEDTYRIGCSLLNENSIHFLNNGTNDISNKTKELLIKIFMNYDKEKICVNKNITNQLYKNEINLDKDNNDIIDNNDEIIYNPNNYFYFNAYKFIKY